MDFWSPEEIKDFIGIEQAFEEFCEADPELGRLDSTKPDPKCNPKEFKEWFARYCPVQDDATERFVELFREKSLVAIAWHDGKEKVLPPVYWNEPVTSLTIIKGKVQGLQYDDPDRYLENCRVVLRREEWEQWINGAMSGKPAENFTPKPASKEEKPRSRGKTDVRAKAELKIRIKSVHAIALRKWPNPKKRPRYKAMAKDLADNYGEKLDYKFSAIHQILIGTYPAAKRLGIGRF